MKFKMEMDEGDLKDALVEWAQSKHDLDIEKKNITLTIHKGESDPRGFTPDSVSVEIEYTKS